MASKAEQAVTHIMRQMQADGRLAYLLGWGSESFRLLTEAAAEMEGRAVDELAEKFADSLRPERVVSKEAA